MLRIIIKKKLLRDFCYLKRNIQSFEIFKTNKFKKLKDETF